MELTKALTQACRLKTDSLFYSPELDLAALEAALKKTLVDRCLVSISDPSDTDTARWQQATDELGNRPGCLLVRSHKKPSPKLEARMRELRHRREKSGQDLMVVVASTAKDTRELGDALTSQFGLIFGVAS
jgi:hypothetical protein